MDRRLFLLSGVAAAGLTLTRNEAASAQAVLAPGDARLTAAFDTVLARTIREAPEFATSLGLDTGMNADLRHRLGDNSYGALGRDLAQNKTARATIAAVDPATLSPQARIDREVVLYNIDSNIVGPERFGLDSPQNPYAITQQDGVYFELPDFLASTHPVKTADDAEAYLDRLSQMGRQFDNETEVQRRAAAKGRLAPDFSLDLALGQMAQLRAPAAARSALVTALTERTTARKLPGDWQGRAARIVETQVYPALDRQSPRYARCGRMHAVRRASGQFRKARRSTPPLSPNRRRPACRRTRSTAWGWRRWRNSARSSTRSCAGRD
jgi:uncharacterized protein (DUF885 family)